MLYVKENSYVIASDEYEFNGKEHYISVEENSEFGKIIINNFPFIKIKQKDGVVTDVIVLEKPEPIPYTHPKSELEILQERILQLEVAEVNRRSQEIENKLLGGI